MTAVFREDTAARASSDARVTRTATQMDRMLGAMHRQMMAGDNAVMSDYESVLASRRARVVELPLKRPKARWLK